MERASSDRVHRLGQLAALPAVHSWEREDSLELLLLAPGASAKNVQVVWDEHARRIAIAVWAPRAPSGKTVSSRSAGVSWYKPLELVGFDGSRTTAWVGSSRIGLSVPRAVPERSGDGTVPRTSPGTISMMGAASSD